MDKLSIFSKRLRETRIKKGMTQKQLADKVGATAATISAYESADENKRKSPTLEKLVQISAVLDASIDWLCDNVNKPIVVEKNENKMLLSDLVKVLIPLCQCEICTIKGKEYERVATTEYGEPVETYTVPAAQIEFENSRIEKVLTGLAKLIELHENGYLPEDTYKMSLQGVIEKSSQIQIDTEIYAEDNKGTYRFTRERVTEAKDEIEIDENLPF